MKYINKRDRNSNLEILRIISMILIVAFHCNFNFKFESSNNIFNVLIYSTGIWGILGVDCFFIISFNFLQESKFKSKKLLHLILQILFYTIIFIILANKITNISVLKILMSRINDPIWSNVYWFVTIYLFVYLSFPLLNKILNNLNKMTIKKIIILFTIIIFFFQMSESVIEDYFFAIYIYIVCYYLKKFNIKFGRKNCKIYFVITSLIIIFLKIIYTYSNICDLFIKIIAGDFGRHSILFFIDSIFLFYIFDEMPKRSSKIINKISSSVFGVYLIHENQILSLRDYIYFLFARNIKWLSEDGFLFNKFLLYITEIIIIFLLGITIEFIRQNIFEKFILSYFDVKINKYYNKIDNWVNDEKLEGVKNEIINAHMLRAM